MTYFKIKVLLHCFIRWQGGHLHVWYHILLFALLLLKFCPTTLSPFLANKVTERNSIIRNYFNQGFSYIEIVTTLFIVHSISLSLTHVKRLLASLRLKPWVLKNGETPDCNVILVTSILKALRNSSVEYRITIRVHGEVWKYYPFPAHACRAALTKSKPFC